MRRTIYVSRGGVEKYLALPHNSSTYLLLHALAQHVRMATYMRAATYVRAATHMRSLLSCVYIDR